MKTTAVKKICESIKETEDFISEMKSSNSARFYDQNLKKMSKQEFLSYQEGVSKGLFIALMIVKESK